MRTSGTSMSQTSPLSLQASDSFPPSWPRTTPSSTREPKPRSAGGAGIGGPPASTQRSFSIPGGPPSSDQVTARRPSGAERAPCLVAFVAAAPGSSTGGFGQKIPFHHQLPDLRVQLLNLSLGRLCALLRRRLTGEHRRQPLHGLPLPLTHHRLVNAVLGCQLRRRQLTPQCFQGHFRLEIRRISRSLARHPGPSFPQANRA